MVEASNIKETNKLRDAGFIFALGALSISGLSSVAKIVYAGMPLPAGDSKTCTTTVSAPSPQAKNLYSARVPVSSGSIFYPVSTYS